MTEKEDVNRNSGSPNCSTDFVPLMTERDKYFDSLDSALMAYASGKEDKFDDHCQRFGLADKLPNVPLAKRGAVMKIITARTSLPMWVRTQARKWLVDRGFQPWDDGDVLVIP